MLVVPSLRNDSASCPPPLINLKGPCSLPYGASLWPPFPTCLLHAFADLRPQVLDWIENHGEAFLSKHTGVGKSLHRARALQKRHEDFEEVAQVPQRFFLTLACQFTPDMLTSLSLAMTGVHPLLFASHIRHYASLAPRKVRNIDDTPSLVLVSPLWCHLAGQ